MQRDPIGDEGGLNLYAYCGGDPVNACDPNGLRDNLEMRMYPQNTEADGSSGVDGEATGSGHVWLEVTEDGKTLYSIGAYGKTGKCLSSPDPAQNATTARTIKVFPANHDENLKMIEYYKGLVENQKDGEWYAQPGDEAKYVKNVEIMGIKTPLPGLDIKNFRCCTTVARELAIKGGKVTEPIPLLLQPNNMWNYYHPDKPLPAGDFRYKGRPSPP